MPSASGNEVAVAWPKPPSHSFDGEFHFPTEYDAPLGRMSVLSNFDVTGKFHEYELLIARLDEM